MTKPVTIRPKTFEIVGGMIVVVFMAGVILSRSGPQSLQASETTPGRGVVPSSQPMMTSPAPSTQREKSPVNESAHDAPRLPSWKTSSGE